MINNKNIIDPLLTILKKEHSIINLSQTVEIISLLILVRYFEVKLKRCYNREFLYSSSKNLDEYVQYCKCLLNDSTNLYIDIINSDDMHKLLFAPLENTFLKMNARTVFNEINPLLSDLATEMDFFFLAEDYRALIEKMVFESLSTGVFSTPKALCELLVKTIKPKSNDKIYDAACGTGGFLLEANNYILNNENILFQPPRLVGREIASFPAIISLVSFILTGSKVFHLELADSLNEKSDHNLYDVILANPPFGQLEKYEDKSSYKEYLFLKHIMGSLKNGGHAAVILPDRFLWDKGKTCKQLKEQLFHSFCVQGVLLLPPGTMLPSTAIKIVILFFSKTPPAKDIWVYQLNSVERFTRKNRLTIEILEDFINKYEDKIVSENSWRVQRNQLGEEYNLFQHNNDFEHFRHLDVPQKYLSECQQQQKRLAISLDKVTQKIAAMSSQINGQFDNYKFSSVRLGDLIRSLSCKALTQNELLDDGQYPVYGGNGIIGYYNEYLHSGNFIIIGRVGAYCGNVHYVEGDVWATNNAIILTCPTSRVHPPYLAKILAKKDLRQLSSGTAQRHLTMQKLNEVIIELPLLSIQIELDQWLTELEQELSLQQKLIDEMTVSKKAMSDALYQHLLAIDKK